MRLLFGHDRDVAHFVALNIPHLARRLPDYEYGEVFGIGRAIGVIDDAGRLVGGVVYHNHDPYSRTIELSFAATSRRWLTREIICALLRYPFDQLDCNRITGVTPRKATSARRFLDKFGFRREGVATDGFGTDDAIISRLLRREWQATKWAKPLPTRRETRVRVDGEVRAENTART